MATAQHIPIVVEPPQPARLVGPSLPPRPIHHGTIDPVRRMLQQQPESLQRYFLKQEALERQKQETLAEIDRFARGEYTTPAVRYGFPMPPPSARHNRFAGSLIGLLDMLEDKAELNITRAVYLVESAYDPSLTYESFQRQINTITNQCYAVMRQAGFAKHDNVGKNLAIFAVMADTVRMPSPNGEGMATHYPYVYDFDDPFAKKDPAKMFVSKLLRHGSGNCSSLPRLYLMVAEAMSADASLAFSPNHSYVKFPNKFGEYINVELTNGMTTTDNAIMENGWVKSEAVKHGTYMRPITKRELIAHHVNDLAILYEKQYGATPFIMGCVDTALKYFPKSITAHKIRYNYTMRLFDHAAAQHKRLGHTKAQAFADGKLMRLFKLGMQYQAAIERMGFSHVPEALYKQWVKGMATQAAKERSRAKIRQMLQTIDH